MAFFKKHFNLLILLALGLAAFIRGIIFLDPDFGWHLRMGELIISHGIPLTDPFSYTMPSYNFIDHEWLSNVLMFLGFKSIGIYGLSFISALIFVTTLFIAIPKKFKSYSYLPLALAGSLMLNFVGIRTQIITWFFLSVILKVVFDDDLWKKWKFFLPLLFIPWVNLHGGFAVGVAILALIFVFKSAQHKKFELSFLTVFLSSLILTFVNPYGPRIWWEIWMQASDSSLRWNISEWAPAIFFVDIALLVLFTLSLFFVFKYKTKIGGLKTTIYLFLLLMALSSIRHIPLWTLSAILATSVAIKFLMDEIKKVKYGKERIEMVKKILFVVILPIFIFEIYISLASASSLKEQDYYPVQAAKFLNKTKLKGNIFTGYNYAGYLLWKVPAKKDFIDGRMPSLRRTGFYPNDTDYAFKDYLKMLSNENSFKKMLKKYDIHYMLFPSLQKTKNKKVTLLEELEKYLQKYEFWRMNTKVMDEDLTKIGMKEIYNDGKFVIYQK